MNAQLKNKRTGEEQTSLGVAASESIIGDEPATVFRDYTRKHRGRLEDCDCGGLEGRSAHPVSPHAHPETCAAIVSMDVLWDEFWGGAR